MAVTPTSANTHISSDWAALLEPGIREVFYRGFNYMPEQYTKIFKIKKSKRSFEEEYGMGNMEAWGERVNETDNVAYQKIGQGLQRTFTHSEFASGFQIGKRLYEDEMYNIINGMATDLGEAAKTKIETDAATVLTGGFTNTGYDSVSLFSDSHPYEGGKSGTQSNLVSGALSDTTLKEAITMMRGFYDNGGKKILFQPDILIVPPALEWLAIELTKSTLKPDTANNDINSVRGRLKIVVYDYLTSDTAWFVADSKRMKLIFNWRVKPQFVRHEDKDPFVSKYAGRMRYSYGYSDWKGIVGSLGT